MIKKKTTKQKKKQKKKNVSAIVALILGEFIPSPQAVFIQRTRRGRGRGVLSPRVPKVRRKGPCSPAIFREICSAILGPSKLAAERISVHFMHLMETNARINIMKSRN